MSSRTKPIEVLLASGMTVFSIDDLRMFWKMKNTATMRVQIRYYVTTGRILRLHRGIYALHAMYDPMECAQKLVRPSYISLDAALRMHGVIHQYSEEMTCIARYPRSYTIGGRTYQYHQITLALLSCPIGVRQQKTYAIASPERALCDALYLGFNPDTAAFTRWDKVLLATLAGEFSAPRVQHGLRIRSLL